MSNYYIAETNDEQFNAANKAREDVEICFEECRYKKDYTYINLLKSNKPKLRMVKELISGLLKYNRDDCIFFQYPYYKNKKKMIYIFNKLKKYKSVKLVAIIHDLDSLRYNKEHNEVREEINSLNMCDYVISHNARMSEWLKENGCNSNIVNLEIFDYLLPNSCNINNERKSDIIFAGNLSREKSGFIYKLIEKDSLNCKINLYGPNFSGNIKNKDIKYCGKYPPDELISNLEGKFGLIWDGEELDKCSGNTGNYTRYNNPHKLSMYIAANLPVICWREMAIAQFVVDNKIGFCIDSLDELDNLVKDINEEEYNHILNNIYEIRQKVIEGAYIKNVLKSIDISSKEKK